MASRNGNRRRPIWEFELDTAKQQLNQQFTRVCWIWGRKCDARTMRCWMFDPICQRHSAHRTPPYPFFTYDQQDSSVILDAATGGENHPEPSGIENTLAEVLDRSATAMEVGC